MKAVLAKVKSASVDCEGRRVAEMGKGFLILLGVTSADTKENADKLASKISGLRIFEDENGKMNLSLGDVGGTATVVSNFTLAGDVSHGRRPSFDTAMRSEGAEPLYEYFIERLLFYGVKEVQKGVFGGDMTVTSENDGPCTFIVDTDDLR